MELAFGTESGSSRKVRDAHLVESLAPGITLFAIADGFGEVSRGAQTAPLALSMVRDYVRRRYRAGALGRGGSASALRTALLAAMDHANGRLYAQSGSHDDYVGGGTSLTAVLIAGHHALVGHVGDARAYLLRLGRLETLTADDAMFADATVTSPKRSLPPKPRVRGLLWRSLGTQPKLEASIAHLELLWGDQMVLCTDGVHGRIEGDEVVEALEEHAGASDVVAHMLQLAKARGGGEIGTVIVARDLLVPSLPAGRAARPRPLRTILALVLLVATLLSYGAFALRADFHRSNDTAVTDRP